MFFLRRTVSVQCFDGDGCCGDDCRVGVVVLLVVVMLMVVVWKLVFLLVVAVVIMVVFAAGCCDVDGGCLVFMLVVAVVMMVVVVQCPPGRNLWQPPPSLSQFLARPRLVESSHFLFLSLRHLRS